MTGFSFILKDSNITIIKTINVALIKKIKSSFYKGETINAIQSAISNFVLNAIRNTETWKSLSGADPRGLDAHFGLNANTRTARLNHLLDIWAKEIKVVPRAIREGRETFTMSYDFYAIESNFGNVLSSHEAFVENKSKRSNEGKTPKIIPWLHWLLIAGTEARIDGYHISFGNYNTNNSRSGKAIMKINYSWVTPPEFAGTINDNFITRALENVVENENFKNTLVHILESVAAPGSLKGFDFSSIDEDAI